MKYEVASMADNWRARKEAEDGEKLEVSLTYYPDSRLG